MKAIKLTCELNKKWENGYYVTGQKRFPGEKFEIINPNPGQILNIKRSCDVVESEIDIEEDIEIETPEKDKELLVFAQDLWNEVVALRQEIESLQIKHSGQVKEEIEPKETKNTSGKVSKKRKKE